MRRFLNNLFRDFRTTSTPRSTRRLPHRATLNLEGLEDRLVPTTLTLRGSTLTISDIRPAHTIQIQCQSNGAGGMEVFDNGNLVNNEVFNKMTIKTVNIAGTSNDQVYVNDTDGMPFANANINLSGGINTLWLQGARAVAGNETYSAGSEINEAGAILATPATISLDNLTFTLHGVPTVVDEIPISGSLDVQSSSGGTAQASGAGPELSQNGFGAFNIPGTACLQYLGFGAGTTLCFSQKPNVILPVYAPNTAVYLQPASATGLNSFQVEMAGAADSVIINGTDASVATYVYGYSSGLTVNLTAFNHGYVGITCFGSGAHVNISMNDAVVNIQGNSTTDVLIGGDLNNGYTTQYIDANIDVSGAANLTVDDAVNTPTNVKNTNGTISGFGLFGNNGVTVSYSNVFIAVVEYK
jgi:hypothetical protein